MTRDEAVERAREAGCGEKALTQIEEALRISLKATILLPTRFGHCSRAKGWARCGSGDNASWGEEEEGGRSYRVGPGKWIVYSSDGFHRSEKQTWTVKNIQVGDEIWTVAN